MHVVCRTLAEARGVRDEIILERPGARLVPHGVDLARLRDIRAFSAALGDDGTERKAPDGTRSPRPRPRPRLLVHCAGAMAARWRRGDAAWDDEDEDGGGGKDGDPEDASGWERVAAVNARAPAMLTETLLAANALARPARVVFVGSFTHRAAFPGDQDRWFDDAAAVSRENNDPSSRRRRARRGGGGLSSGGGGSSSLSPRRRRRPPRDTTTMSPAASYACSKAAVTAYALGRTAAGECDCIVWDPGLVDTDLAREWPRALRGLYVGVAKRVGLMVPPAAVADAAWAAAAAIDPGEVRRAGGCYAYGTRCVAMKPGGRAREPSAMKRATAFLAAASGNNGVGGSDPPERGRV